ncbi:MAG TPA: hypothetical protein VJ111_16140 [Chitinophagaceae bacterium]|nr:hypothetical protein [Chitinophagaceae bacterium]
MKKAIVFICVIAAAITLNSCKKTMYYACCDTGHAHWEGAKTEKKSDATRGASDHDLYVHPGPGQTATVCISE